jgi:predicted acylesterase/phospholipase RssA
LGHAVAASACVPGLFAPLSMKRLYPNRVVRWVDGGVYDNQGVSSLLEQDCTLLLVSDASGQMRSADRPGGIAFQVLSRSSEILSSRVRETEYHDLGARQRSSRLHGLMFVHLKKDLTGHRRSPGSPPGRPRQPPARNPLVRHQNPSCPMESPRRCSAYFPRFGPTSIRLRTSKPTL